MAAAAPALMDELIEECFLRLPPDDPANLVRAALVCKGWRRIVTHRGFGHRFRELHGRPLMLGFLHIHTRYGCLFTLMSSSWRNSHLRLGGWYAIDLRHGRILLSSAPSLYGTSSTRRRVDLAVWDPVSGEQLDLPEPPPPQQQHWFGFTSKAAVLCPCASSSARGHLDCHRGHFLVVLMDATCDKVDVYVYSSQAGAWSHQTSAAQDRSLILLPRQPVTMAGNALYFIARKWRTNGILRYEMRAHDVSWVDLPPDCSAQSCQILLTTMENGRLGIVKVDKKNSRLLRLWSAREAGPNGVLGWAQSGVIELETVLPANSGSISTVAFVHGLSTSAFFFITTENAGAFAVDLEYNRVRKLCGKSRVNYFVPYTSLCTPALTG